MPRTGAVGSVQEAEVTLPASVLEQVWKPEYLQRLARAYWRHISRATLGLIRVVYSETAPTVVLLSRRLPLLRFHAPDYDISPQRGSVVWRIDRGLLVARDGRDNGFLRFGVRRLPDLGDGGESTLAVALEVRNFYPWLRGTGRFARLGASIYGQTQLRIHVLVCNAFLRSLARLDLPPTPAGALSAKTAASAERPPA